MLLKYLKRDNNVECGLKKKRDENFPVYSFNMNLGS